MVSASDCSHIKVLSNFFSHPPSSAAILSYVFLYFTNKQYCRNLQFITVKSNYRLLKLYYIRQITNFTEREEKRNEEKDEKKDKVQKNDYKSKYKKVVCLLVFPPSHLPCYSVSCHCYPAMGSFCCRHQVHEGQKC